MITCRGFGVFCVLLVLAGCGRASNGAEFVGDQCLPETLPSGPVGSGFLPVESYLTEDSACEGNPCLVHRLVNSSDGGLPSDPNVLCEGETPAPGCVTAAAVERSVHCSCRCAGPGNPDKECRCPDGYTCRQLAPLREDGTREGPRSYCVKPQGF